MRKIIIIGGVAGGATAATRLRRLSENLKITIFEKSNYVSFANCGLPYHIGNIISDRNSLLLQTPKSFKERYNIDVKIASEVIEIDRESKRIKVKNLIDNSFYFEEYDKLLLSPGAEPFLPKIKGLKKSNYFFLRNMEDMDGIIENIKTHSAKKILVIGGGYIGMEIVENLALINCETFLVEKNNQLMSHLDIEIGIEIENKLRENHINLFLQNQVERIKPREGTYKIYLKNGERFKVDLIILATGVQPRIKLAKKAKLAIGVKGGILVNGFLQTSDPDIYAVGDVIQVNNFVSNQPTLIPLAWSANRQGRIVADNIFGGNTKIFKSVLGTSIVKVFDLSIASTGLSEKNLKALKIPYKVAAINRKDHAGYYPGAVDIYLKLLFGKEGKILGIQGIGEKGVDKRIDVIATSMKAGLKVTELEELELAYAPPFGSAKDPINILGYLARNILEEAIETIEPVNLIAELEQNQEYALLDVRTPQEYEKGAILNSKNIDINILRSKLHELDRNKTYIVYCRVGYRSYLACRILLNNGFKAKNLTGGYTVSMPILKYFHSNFVGIEETPQKINIAISNKYKFLNFQSYPNSPEGVDHFFRDLKNWNFPVFSIIFFMEFKEKSTLMQKRLNQKGVKIHLFQRKTPRSNKNDQIAITMVKQAISNYS